MKETKSEWLKRSRLEVIKERSERFSLPENLTVEAHPRNDDEVFIVDFGQKARQGKDFALVKGYTSPERNDFIKNSYIIAEAAVNYSRDIKFLLSMLSEFYVL